MSRAKKAEEKEEIEAERREMEKEWLIATDEGYKHEEEEFSPSRRLQELLEDSRAKRHQQDDGSYILSYIEDGLYKEIRKEIMSGKVEEKNIEMNKDFYGGF